MSISDPTAALAMFLRSNLSDLIDGRTYRPQLPKSADKDMAQACIVVRRAGGLKVYGKSQLPISDPTVDLICYGATAMEAETVAAAACAALKGLVMEVWEGVMLYSANIIAGPLPLPDLQTLWPAALVSTQVLHRDYTDF